VIAVDEINVGVPGRSEENGVAGGTAGSGVSGRIVDSEVGFDFDDAGDEASLALAHQNFSQKGASDAARAPAEESAFQRVDCRECGEDDGLGHATF